MRQEISNREVRSPTLTGTPVGWGVRHVFIAKDKDGSEGIPAFSFGSLMMPLVAADEARVKSLREKAQEIATASGQALTLCKFTLRKELEVIEP